MSRLKKRKISHLLKCKKGTTLLELMVSFMLTAILMTAAIATISPAMRAFSKVLEMSHAQGVTDVILEEISGELESANKILSISRNEIKYSNQIGQGVIMAVGDNVKVDEQDVTGMLLLNYEKEGVKWYIPERTYMGFKIENLQFQQVGEKNLIEVKVQIKNPKNDSTYNRTKVVECYKLANGIIGE